MADVPASGAPAQAPRLSFPDPDYSPVPFQPPEGMLDYTNYPKVRQYFLDRVKTAMSAVRPVKNEQYELSVGDVDYVGKPLTVKDEESAIREGRTLSKRLTGRFTLRDLATGKTLTTHRRTLMNVPWMTTGGYYVVGGVPYSFAHQFRMDPGIYVRKTEDGVSEAQFNVAQGSGTAFRLRLEPETGIFAARIAGRNIPLYHLLNSMGVSDAELQKSWGPQLLEINRKKKPHSSSINWLNTVLESEKTKLSAQLAKPPEQITDAEALRSHFARLQLGEENTQRIMGKPYANVTPEAMLHATSRILNVANSREDSDSRDNPSNQRVFDEGDHFETYLKLDRGGVMRQALWKLRNDPERLKKLGPALFDQHVSHHLNNSGLAQVLEQINPLDAMSQAHKITRLGEGAIENLESAPDEAREVQSGYLGMIDPIKGPESLRLGLDMYLARTAVKGPDNRLYARFKDTKTGQPVWLNSVQLETAFIADPNATTSEDQYVPAMSPKYGIRYLPKKDVKYEIYSGDDLFTAGSDSIPYKSGVKGMRQLMGSKFLMHALPLENGEAPLVQTPTRDGTPSAAFFGQFAGAVRAPVAGTVISVDKHGARIRDAKGQEHEASWYEWVPFARKTYLSQTPVVKVGDQVKPGSLLAKSNYTDDQGRLAVGKNLRVGYLAYQGKTFEDAMVISQSAADKLTSLHMYRHEYEPDPNKILDRTKFLAMFPSVYTKEQLAGVDPSGIVRPGTTVRKGDPLILAFSVAAPDTTTMGRKLHSDKSETWEYDEPGIVKAIIPAKNGIRIFVEARHRMNVADKLALPFGAKGVVGEIVPDSEMPQDEAGNPLDVVISPLGVISRTNTAQIPAAVLGKVAAKTGKPYLVNGYTDDELTALVESELQKNGMTDTETLFDPRSGKNIPDVLTGVHYVYKMQQMAEDKGKARETGGYSMDEDPSKGGGRGGKHIGDMEYGAFMAHGVPNVWQDFKTIHGQSNPDFWRQVKLGGSPVVPRIPEVYNKFRALIRSAGVTLNEDPNKGDSVFASTDADIKKLTGTREITKAETYDRNMKPIPGGIFDADATGSTGAGDRFAFIRLPEPMLNPLMEPPIRHILGLKASELEDIMTGRQAVNGKIGSAALQDLLSRVRLPDVIQQAKETLKNGTSASKKDAASKQLIYAQAMNNRGISPVDFLMTRVPVLPPRFRRIVEQDNRLVVPDLNYMYRRLLHSSEDFRAADALGPEAKADAREDVLRSYRALVGLEDPIDKDLQAKRVGGVLKQLLGKGSPKVSFTQRKVFGTNIDLAGLGVIYPNPALKLNEVGIPEDYAWSIFGPFVIRRMVEHGRGAMEAARALKDRDPVAKSTLQAVMQERPVLLNRAPTLHKYGIMAFKAIPVAGKGIQLNPQAQGPFSADNDGDTMSFTVPVSQNAVKEAWQKMLPDKHLLTVRSGAPHYAPSQETHAGLYIMTKPPKTNRPMKVFETKNEMIAAWRRGEIDADDPVQIREM